MYLTTYDNLEYWKVKLEKVVLITTEWLNVQCTLKHLINVKLNEHVQIKKIYSRLNNHYFTVFTFYRKIISTSFELGRKLGLEITLIVRRLINLFINFTIIITMFFLCFTHYITETNF